MMRKNKFWALLNLLVTLVTIFWNYYANTGVINDQNVGSLSDKYDSLFTPAGYTFSIWGVIYLGLIYNSIYTLRKAFKAEDNQSFILKSAPWLVLANLLNCLWLWFWLNESIGISTVILFGITFVLTIAVIQLNMERWDAPTPYMAGIWWPIVIYFGWVSVATIANTSIFLKSISWEGGLSEELWAIIMVIVAALLNFTMVLKRNMREFAVVGIWALVGIAVKNWDAHSAVSICCIICAAILLITVSIHAYKNRKTLPFIKRSDL